MPKPQTLANLLTLPCTEVCELLAASSAYFCSEMLDLNRDAAKALKYHIYKHTFKCGSQVSDLERKLVFCQADEPGANA